MSNESLSSNLPENTNFEQKQKILIGSQRNPDAFRAKPSIPAVDPENPKDEKETADSTAAEKAAAKTAEPAKSQPLKSASFNKDSFENPKRKNRGTRPGGNAEQDEDDDPDQLVAEGFDSLKNMPLRSASRVPVPRLRGKMSDDLEREFSDLFGGAEMESLMSNVDQVASQEIYEPETKMKGKIISISQEDAFFEIGGRDQGTVSLKQFSEFPEVGQEWDVIVMKYLPSEGLYDLTLPLAAADVREWEQITEGMILNAKVTGANTGGLECEVNKLRGFIPMSQIAVFRVEKPEEFIGEMFQCVVTEVNPARRNLVLSRRAMLEREREEQREKLLAELEVGQVREGLVRKIIDAGAFVDLGGVDGFVPIGALSWTRVKHPSDVLKEGSRIKVKITKLDPESNRISLAYRDDAENPWSNVHERFHEKMTVSGKVTRIMDFGAFVELAPGLEGLVHISELAHKRVGSVSEVLKEGDMIGVLIQSIDPSSRRISLSIKQLTPLAPPKEGEASAEGESPEPPPEPLKLDSPVKQHKGPLKGGIGSQSEGEKFGLKW